MPIGRILLQSKYRIPYESADKVVVLSENYFSPYLYYAGIKHSEKMIAIGNSLRFAQYITPNEIINKEKTVIVVARFDEDTKRLSYALRAWREIEKDTEYSDWKLQLVGDGRDMAFYRHLVKKWQLKHVEFTGQQNPEDYYNRASIFLMTSTAEGWPMVILEALQMGVPVIAMDSFGALHDMITDGYNGSIVPNNDIKNFIHAMKVLMKNEELRNKMATNAVESSKHFEITNILAQWKILFEQLNH
jgi:glycosyltransferase involved in cell wall biosynthesis